ncbi:hypothetical protein Tco_0658292 [Tanacetum coccineum]
MDAPTIPVSVDSSEGNFGDAPAAADAFPAVTIVAILASLGEAIRGIHEDLQGVPVEEDMSTLRFRMSMIEAENAYLCGKIRTMEAIETKMAPKQTTRSTPVTPAPTATTTTVTEAQLQALIDQGVAAVMAEAELKDTLKETTKN